MASTTIALNANHSTIQQFHVEFCCLMKRKLIFINNNIEKVTKWREYQKCVRQGTTLRKTLLCLPIFAKRSNKTCCKRSHYVKDSKSRNLGSLCLLLKFHKLIFLLLKWILKIKISIQHPSAEPEKVLRYWKLKLHPNYGVIVDNIPWLMEIQTFRLHK